MLAGWKLSAGLLALGVVAVGVQELRIAHRDTVITQQQADIETAKANEAKLLAAIDTQAATLKTHTDAAIAAQERERDYAQAISKAVADTAIAQSEIDTLRGQILDGANRAPVLAGRAATLRLSRSMQRLSDAANQINRSADRASSTAAQSAPAADPPN